MVVRPLAGFRRVTLRTVALSCGFGQLSVVSRSLGSFRRGQLTGCYSPALGEFCSDLLFSVFFSSLGGLSGALALLALSSELAGFRRVMNPAFVVFNRKFRFRFFQRRVFGGCSPCPEDACTHAGVPRRFLEHVTWIYVIGSARSCERGDV